MDMAKIVQENSMYEDYKGFVLDEVCETIEESEDTPEFLISQYCAFEEPLVYQFIVKEMQDNVAYVQLCPIDFDQWEIGYQIVKRFTGNGSATEALKAFLPVIIKTAGLSEVYGICLAENKASIEVMRKCGFEKLYSRIGKYQEIDSEIFTAV